MELHEIDLGAMVARQRGEPRKPALTGADAINALRDAAARFLVDHTFKAGDLIIQKDGLASHSHAGDRASGNPAIFLRYEPEVVELYDTLNAGVPYELAMIDCLVGWIHVDGGMVISAACSQIYEPWSPVQEVR